MTTREILIALDIYYEHDWYKVYDVIKSADVSAIKFDNDNLTLIVEAELYGLIHQNYKVVTIVDPEYPRKILHKPTPPFVIYYKNDLETLEDRYSYTRPEVNPKRMFVD